MSNHDLTYAKHTLKMTQNRPKNLATITFVVSNETEVRTIAHLKKVKEKTGVEIKAQILRAVTTLTDLYSIGDDPNCTKQDLEDATVNFLLDLTTQINRGLVYAQNHRHQIDQPPKSWTQFCQMADSIFPPTIVPKSPDSIVDDDDDDDEDDDDEDDDQPVLSISTDDDDDVTFKF